MGKGLFFGEYLDSSSGAVFSETAALTADFDGTHDDTEAVGNAVKLALTGGGDDAYTKLLLHLDGSNDGTTFTDEKGKTVTRVGDTVTKTAVKKFGTASAYFDGTGDALTVASHADLTFGTGDFTVDFWVNFATVKGIQWLVSGDTREFDIRYDNATGLMFSNDGSSMQVFGGAGMFSAGTMYHVAIVRHGSDLMAFVNGIQLGSTASNSVNMGGFTLRIGQTTEGSGIYDFNGYIDEFRVSNIARWATNFTPPTAAYGADEYTALGTYTHHEMTLPAIPSVTSSQITYDLTTPTGTSGTVEVAIDDGTGYGDWETKASGDSLIPAGVDATGYKIQWRFKPATTDPGVTPSLTNVKVEVKSGQYKYSGDALLSRGLLFG